MKKLFVLILFAIMILIIACCSTAWKSIQASLPDLNGKPDGVYRGEYHVSGTPVKVILDVTLQNEQLTLIKIIEHNSSPIGKKAERLVDTIIERQSLDIDAVSGATASSKGILKATENALQ